MSANDSNEEALREALLNIQRLREKEQIALQQSETLMAGIQILNESSSVSDIFKDILGTLQKVIPFECAAILVESSEGILSTAACTDKRLKYSAIPIDGVFQRCLSGTATVLHNMSRVKEWPTVQGAAGEQFSSALLVPLSGLAQSTLVVCAGSDRYKLRKKDLGLLTTFTPLATQAVKRAGEIEKLNMIVSKLDYYAHYDVLTGLPNRTLFDIRLDQELKKPNNEFSVLFLDLDNFKHTNDSYGHDTGDVLLCEIAFRITGVLAESDTIARMGGDEFAVIVRGSSDEAELRALCERITSRVSHPLFLSKTSIEPSASIGVVASAQDIGVAQIIMQNADIALYDAKNKGRDCHSLFNLEMKKRLDRINTIEKRLKTALNNEEFRLAYQPILSAKTLSCPKVEVLVRWEVGGEPLFYPDEFIPIAEKTGDICELGAWIFRQALIDLYDWLLTDSCRTAAINISDAQLHDTGLSEQLLSIATELGVVPHQIELELSERIVATEVNEIVSANIQSLQTHGFGFSFDDFGTGQSSFLNLQKFPGTILKIDKTFIDELEKSSGQKTLIMGIVKFSHSLGLEVVAEGVETQAQLRMLRSISCDYVQGYLLARPMDLIEFYNGYDQSDNEIREAS